MKPEFDFSEEDSEKFIREFKDVTDGPMADVAAALRSLSHTPQLPPRAKPKVFPSQISIKPSHKLRFFGGGVVTGVATIGAAAGLALGAAAVTGNFPPVISDTAKKVAHVISNVFTSDPVTPTSEDQLNNEVVQNVEESVAPTVSEPAPQQSQAPQQPVAPVEKKKDQSQLPAQNLPAAPKPSALAQPDVPAISNQEDNDESEGKSDSGNSEKSENTKSETEKSENSSLNPITATPSANEKKDTGEKKAENKNSESKDEKDD
jgi:hypothetical protein